MQVRRQRAKAVAAYPASAAVLLVVLLTQGCTTPKPPVHVSTTKTYAVDFAGASKQCVVPKDIKVIPGKETDVAMTVASDGGWCAVPMEQVGDKPYSAGLVVTRPTHGKVYVHTVGDDTRVDYTPDRGFAGTDAFSVKLIPGDPVIRVTATVSPS